jgi:Sec-independent protein translocase protein TatA
MGSIELAIPVALVLLLFGANRLPDTGNALGYVRGKSKETVDDPDRRAGAQ